MSGGNGKKGINMYRVCTHYLNGVSEPEVYRRDFETYNEAMTYYAYEIVANDSTANGRNVMSRGFDYINVSLWKVDDIGERLVFWKKAFF